MASTEWILAGAGANDAAVGELAWANPGNITSAGSPYASITQGSGGDKSTNYLVGKTFGHAANVPVGATIVGVEFLVAAKWYVSYEYTEYYEMTINNARLLRAGVLAGDAWSFAYNTLAYETFGDYTIGSESWLAGLTLTRNDVIHADFGIGFSARMNAPMNYGAVISADTITSMVYYTAGAGPVQVSRSWAGSIGYQPHAGY